MLIININPKVVLASESRVSKVIEDMEIKIDGYNTIGCDSNSRYIGSVAIYLKNNYKFSVSNSFILYEND